MYKIPSDIDLNFIIGTELSQVCARQNQIVFDFSGEGVISVESSLEITDGQSTIVWNQKNSEVHLPAKLFGTKPEKYMVENERTLAIFFDNNLVVRIFDDSDQYESFQVTDKAGTRYIV